MIESERKLETFSLAHALCSYVASSQDSKGFRRMANEMKRILGDLEKRIGISRRAVSESMISVIRKKQN